MKIKKSASMLLMSVFLLCSCGKVDEKKQTGAMPSLVDVAPLKIQTEEAYFSYPATISSDMDVMILPKASGEITKIFVKDGDYVTKGTIIAQIDDEMVRAQKQAAIAELAAARAELDNAKSQLDRAKALKASTSQKELDLKQAAYSRAQAAEQKAKAALKIAQINEKHSKIVAPFSGHLGEILIGVGDFVQASSTKVARLSNTSTIKVKFFIPDSDREKLKDLALASKASFDYQNEHYEGFVSFIDTNNSLASIAAAAEFSGANVPLESFVKVRLEGVKQPNVVKINKENLLQDINGNYVYIKQDSKAISKHVSVIFEDDKYALIDPAKSDIKDGDLLILNNYKKIHPGSLVATDAEFGAMMAAAKSNPKIAEQKGENNASKKAK